MLFIATTILPAVEEMPLVEDAFQKSCIKKAKRRTLQHNYKSTKLFRNLKRKCTHISNES